MAYIEFLRVRKALLWHIGIYAAIVLIIVAFGSSGNVKIDSGSGETVLHPGQAFPMSAIVLIAAFFGAIFASSTGISLNRESQTREISWTKPISRTLLGLQFVLIDLAGIVIAYAVALAAILIVVVHMHVVPVIDDTLAFSVLLGLGIAAMWYGLLQLITFAFGPAARSMSGILWPVALALGGMAHIPGTVGQLASAIDIINPLVYMGDSAQHNSAVQTGVSALSGDLRVLLVWFFAIGFTAIAVVFWPKKEA